MPRRALWALFFCLASVYLLTAGGHVYSGDGHSLYQTTRALVERGELSLEEQVYVYGATGPDGEFYSKFGVGQSLVAAPLYLVAQQIVTLLGAQDMGAFAGKSASDLCLPITYTLNQFVTAGVVVAFCVVLLQLGFALSSALIAGLALGLTTTLWPYSGYFLSEPLLALCLVLGLLFLLKHSHTGSAGQVLAAGAFAGFACLVKLSAVVALPAYLAYLILKVPAGRRLRAMVMFAAPVGMALITLLALNQLRFGAPFETGYVKDGGLFGGDPLEGMAGQLISPGKSVFLFSPPLLAALFWTRAAFRRFLPEALFCAWVCLAFVVLHGSYHSWMGGYAWGPRYLVAVVPFAFFPVACGLDRLLRAGAGKALWSGLALLAVAGFCVQLLGVLGNYHDYDSVYLAEVMPGFAGNSWELMSWSLQRSHLAASFYLVQHGHFDLWLVNFYGEGVPLKVLLPAALLLCGMLLMSVRVLSRTLVAPRPETKEASP